MAEEKRQNESALVCAAQRRDKTALQLLLKRNWPWLKGLVYSIVHDTTEVDDVLQDIYALEDEMRAYERKYGILSETFYESYVAGEEPPDEAWVRDWTAWASAYKVWLRRHEQYQAAQGSPQRTGRRTAGRPGRPVLRPSADRRRPARRERGG